MNRDPYIYTVNVLKQGSPRVVEEDIEIALERLGYDAQVYEEDDGRAFSIYSERHINMGAVKDDIERLDGASRCKVAIECYQRP